MPRSSIRKPKWRGTSVRAGAAQALARVKRQAYVDTYRRARDASTVAGLANLAVRGLQLAGGELKAKDTSSVPVMVTSTGGVMLLNGIARGDDIDERTGRQVLIKSYEVNAILRPADVGTTPLPSVVRMLVVYDKQTNGAAMTPAQLLTLTGSDQAPIGPKNLEYRDRFTILRDLKVALGAANSADYNPPSRVVKIYQSIVLPVTFNAGDAGTVADIATGSLYLVCLSDKTGAPAPSIAFSTRVRYEDK